MAQHPGRSLAQRYLHARDQHGPYAQALEEALTEWQQRNPGKAWSDGGPSWRGWVNPPGWRAAEGVGQPAFGYPE